MPELIPERRLPALPAEYRLTVSAVPATEEAITPSPQPTSVLPEQPRQYQDLDHGHGPVLESIPVQPRHVRLIFLLMGFAVPRMASMPFLPLPAPRLVLPVRLQV